MELKELVLEDIDYIDSVISEQFGHHKITYNTVNKLCWLAKPIKLPYEQGRLLAMGIQKEKDELVLKIEKIYFTNAIKI